MHRSSFTNMEYIISRGTLDIQLSDHLPVYMVKINSPGGCIHMNVEFVRILTQRGLHVREFCM